MSRVAAKKPGAGARGRNGSRSGSRRERQLAAFIEISRAFTRTSDLDAILQHLFESAASLLGADRCFLLLLTEDRQEIVGTGGHGIDVAEFREVRIPIDATDSGAVSVARTGRSLVSEDCPSDSRLNQRLVGRYGIASALLLPLISEGIPQGTLILGYISPRGFSPEDVSLGQALANEAALAIERYRVLASLAAEKERAQMAAAQLARKDLYIQKMLDPLWVGDSANGTVDVNPAFSRLLGYSREEALDRSCLAFFSPKSRQFLAEHVLPELAEGRSLSFEVELLDQGGAVIPALVSASPIIEDGRITGKLAVCKDLRERKAIEVETVRLQRLELERAQQEEISRMKAQFVANVSHELRTPLNAVIGFTELVSEGVAGEINERQREYLEKALRGSRRLLKMITDLILIAQIEAGRIPVTYDSFLLEDALGRVVRPLEPSARKGGVALTTSVEEGLTVVEADQAKICVILEKLLDNAIKYTPSGGKVEIRAQRLGKDLLEISVSDTGVGLAAKDIERLAKAFLREDRPDPHPAEGAGLGLAVARRLADLQGGRILADSEPGAGATFRLLVPLRS